MISTLRPQMLRPGDLIGVVSPSSAAAHFVPRRLERGMKELENLGFRVQLGHHASSRHGHTAGTRTQRLADLHAMFTDPEVKAIVTTIGGWNSHQLLEELDYELIRRNPKIFMGYSDITALHLAIHARTGLVTFMGPAVLPQFGEAGGLPEYVRDSFIRTVCTAQPVGRILPAPTVVSENLRWDQEDDRPRRMVTNPGPRALRPGRAQGPIIAGNAGTLLLLAGTPYWANLEGAILCLEDDDEQTPGSIDRYFTHLRQMGVFDQIAGLVVGRFAPSVSFSVDDSLDALVLEATRGYDFPIGVDFDFGHWDPMFILPNGVQAELAVADASYLTLLEAAVVEA